MALNSARRSGSNENISTFGLGGLGRDYTSIATWEAATDNDLVTAQVTEVLFLCHDQDDPYPVSSLTISGATTNTDYLSLIHI